MWFDDVERLAVGVEPGQAPEAQRDLGLLAAPAVDDDGVRCRRAAPPGPATAPGSAAGKRCSTSATTSSWSTAPATATTIADGRYQRPKNSRTSSGVMASTDSAVPAVSRPSGWSGKSGFGQQAVRDVLGEVVVHRQLLQDDLALVVDVAVAQRRRGEHVTEELDGQRQVLGRHPAVVRGVLLGREGVDVAADPVDRGARCRARCAPRCP